MGVDTKLSRSDKRQLLVAVGAAVVLAWFLWSIFSAKRALQQQATVVFEQVEAQQKLMSEFQSKMAEMAAQVEGFDAQWNARIDQLGLLRNALPPDDYVIFAQEYAERAGNTLIQDHAGVRFYLRRCEREATTVTCTINIRNVADKTRTVYVHSEFDHNKTLLTDEASNAYTVQELRLAGQTRNAYGTIPTTMEPGLSLNAVFRFLDVPSEAKWATVRLAGRIEGVPNDLQQVSLLLKEVAISSEE